MYVSTKRSVGSICDLFHFPPKASRRTHMPSSSQRNLTTTHIHPFPSGTLIQLICDPFPSNALANPYAIHSHQVLQQIYMRCSPCALQIQLLSHHMPYQIQLFPNIRSLPNPTIFHHISTKSNYFPPYALPNPTISQHTLYKSNFPPLNALPNLYPNPFPAPVQRYAHAATQRTRACPQGH